MSFGIFKRKPRFKTAVKRMADLPVVHQSVPDEVLYPEGKPEAVKDLAWLDDMAIIKKEKPKPAIEQKSEPPKTEWSTTRARAKSDVPQTPSPAPHASESAATNAPEATATVVNAPPAPAPTMSVAAEGNPNRQTSDRPSKPVGWLVVVEGHGVGEWFVLEKGTSHIGSGSDQTVSLKFGDDTVAAARHASVVYDDRNHTFGLAGEKDLRLNGKVLTAGATLRDGDVFTVGNTSLRMVALCTPNFHWET